MSFETGWFVETMVLKLIGAINPVPNQDWEESFTALC